MIINEGISQEKKQMEQANRSLLQQQRQEEDSQLSVSSSSTDSSPSPQQDHSQQQSNLPAGVEQSFKPQSTFHQGPSSRHIFTRRLSPHRLKEDQQRQVSQTTEQKTPLQRQMAFDESHTEDVKSIHSTLPEVIDPKAIPTMLKYSQSFDSKTTILPQQQRVQQLLQQHHIQHLKAGGSSSTSQSHSISQRLAHRSPSPFRTSIAIKSEPPLKYEHSVDTCQSIASARIGSSPGHEAGAYLPASVEHRRARSYSNPLSMMHFPRSSTHTTSTQSLPGSSLSSEASFMTPGTSRQGSSQGIGLFSGSLIGSSLSHLALNIPASAAVEESSSSDETVNEQLLFHSSLMPQKRKSADPAVSESPNWSRISRTIAYPTGSAATNTDPQMRLSNLTTVRCHSTTRTYNTHSPSAVGLAPSGLSSPMSIPTYIGASGSTPSSSASTSPAPLSSLSSLLELSASSPGISSSTFNPHLDTADFHISDHGMSSSHADSHCSATSLSASIDEPIPELYSFLADLEEGGMSSLTSRHGASSNHSTPLALTPKQHDQPLTPDPAYLNVPKIIDEYLDSDKDGL